MNCRIEWAIATDSYHVWLYFDGPNGRRVLRHIEGDVWREDEVVEGSQQPDPTFTLRADWLKALASEALKLPTTSDATVSHLADARDTRDRLLRIVEHRMGVGA